MSLNKCASYIYMLFSMVFYHKAEEQPGWQLCRHDLTPEELESNETLT